MRTVRKPLPDHQKIRFQECSSTSPLDRGDPWNKSAQKKVDAAVDAIHDLGYKLLPVRIQLEPHRMLFGVARPRDRDRSEPKVLVLLHSRFRFSCTCSCPFIGCIHPGSVRSYTPVMLIGWMHFGRSA